VKVGSFLPAAYSAVSHSSADVSAELTLPPRWLASSQPAAAFLAGCAWSKAPVKKGLFVPAGCNAPQRRFAANVSTVQPVRQRRQYVTGGAAADLDAADEHAEEMHADSQQVVDVATYPPMVDQTVEMVQVQGVSPKHFLGLIQSYGTTFFSGVSDPLMKDLSAHIIDKVPCTDHFVAHGPMTALARATNYQRNTGKIPCVYLQNWGLGSTSDPLQGMDGCKVANTPTLLLVGYEEPKKNAASLNILMGDPAADRKKKKKAVGKTSGKVHSTRGSQRSRQEVGGAGEELQGQITPELLKEMGVPCEILPDYAEGAFEVLEKAYKVMLRTQGPFALLFKKDTFRQSASEPRNQDTGMLLVGHKGICQRELDGKA